MAAKTQKNSSKTAFVRAEQLSLLESLLNRLVPRHIVELAGQCGVKVGDPAKEKAGAVKKILQYLKKNPGKFLTLRSKAKKKPLTLKLKKGNTYFFGLAAPIWRLVPLDPENPCRGHMELAQFDHLGFEISLGLPISFPGSPIRILPTDPPPELTIPENTMFITDFSRIIFKKLSMGKNSRLYGMNLDGLELEVREELSGWGELQKPEWPMISTAIRPGPVWDDPKAETVDVGTGLVMWRIPGTSLPYDPDPSPYRSAYSWGSDAFLEPHDRLGLHLHPNGRIGRSIDLDREDVAPFVGEPGEPGRCRYNQGTGDLEVNFAGHGQNLSGPFRGPNLDSDVKGHEGAAAGDGEDGYSPALLTVTIAPGGSITGRVRFDASGGRGGGGGRGGKGQDVQGGPGGNMSRLCGGALPAPGGWGGIGGDAGPGGKGGNGGNGGTITLHYDFSINAEDPPYFACVKGGDRGFAYVHRIDEEDTIAIRHGEGLGGEPGRWFNDITGEPEDSPNDLLRRGPHGQDGDYPPPREDGQPGTNGSIRVNDTVEVQPNAVIDEQWAYSFPHDGIMYDPCREE